MTKKTFITVSVFWLTSLAIVYFFRGSDGNQGLSLPPVNQVSRSLSQPPQQAPEANTQKTVAPRDQTASPDTAGDSGNKSIPAQVAQANPGSSKEPSELSGNQPVKDQELEKKTQKTSNPVTPASASGEPDKSLKADQKMALNSVEKVKKKANVAKRRVKVAKRTGKTSQRVAQAQKSRQTRLAGNQAAYRPSQKRWDFYYRPGDATVYLRDKGYAIVKTYR
ncbi:MAG: hypothetical protein HQK58_10720 [Deltaproteobacteria bacterium]|nr:hypothetical protein [Deltaproteobacteria bacterium]